MWGDLQLYRKLPPSCYLLLLTTLFFTPWTRRRPVGLGGKRGRSHCRTAVLPTGAVPSKHSLRATDLPLVGSPRVPRRPLLACSTGMRTDESPCSPPTATVLAPQGLDSEKAVEDPGSGDNSALDAMRTDQSPLSTGGIPPTDHQLSSKGKPRFSLVALALSVVTSPLEGEPPAAHSFPFTLRSLAELGRSSKQSGPKPGRVSVLATIPPPLAPLALCNQGQPPCRWLQLPWMSPGSLGWTRQVRLGSARSLVPLTVPIPQPLQHRQMGVTTS